MSSFVICINNESNPASLILGKVYRALPDTEAEARNMMRVIDEDKSESDGYLYPASMFAPIELPEAAERALMASDNCTHNLVREEALLAWTACLAIPVDLGAIDIEKAPKSPFDVHGVNTTATTEDVLDAIRESRAR